MKLLICECVNSEYFIWLEEFPSSAYTHFTTELLRKPVSQTKEITISDN